MVKARNILYSILPRAIYAVRVINNKLRSNFIPIRLSVLTLQNGIQAGSLDWLGVFHRGVETMIAEHATIVPSLLS